MRVLRLLFMGFLLFAILSCASKKPRDRNLAYLDEIKIAKKEQTLYLGFFTTHPVSNFLVDKSEKPKAITVSLEAVDTSQVKFPSVDKRFIASFEQKPQIIDGRKFGQIWIYLHQPVDLNAKATEYGLRLDMVPAAEASPEVKSESEAPLNEDLAELKKTKNQDSEHLEKDLEEVAKEEKEEKIAETPEESTPLSIPKISEKQKKLETIERNFTKDKEKIVLRSSKALDFQKTFLDREIMIQLAQTELSENIGLQEIDDPHSFLSKITPTYSPEPYPNTKISFQFRENITPQVSQRGNEIYIEFDRKKPIQHLKASTEVIDFGGYLSSPSELPGREITLQAKETTLTDIFKMLAEMSDFNIIIGEGVFGKVSFRLNRVPWDKAFVSILESHQLGYVKQNNIIRISSLVTLRKEKERARAALQAKTRLEEPEVMLLPLHFQKSAEMKKHLYPLLSEQGSISVDRTSNMLIIKDTPSSLKKIKELVSALDIK